MNITKYESGGRALYADFCDVVAKLLARAIHDAQGYRLQHIQSRAKDPDSLRARLEQSGDIESAEIENIRKDLAGCRIIFYTNNDVNRFARSGLLQDLFEIDWNRSKFHHPGPNSQETKELFQSHNYVVRLKVDRTDLVEYGRFKDLWCEVQVQTTLNHAWAEMAHDIIYKRPEGKGFGDHELDMIKNLLDGAMRDHLLPAGYIFQKIANVAQRLKEGKKLFDIGAVDAVVNAPDNNERKYRAELLRDNVLPYYDDPETEFPNIREKLKQAWLAAHDSATKSRETPFGNFRGVEAHEVAKVITDIFERYRYLEPEATYAVIRDLFVKTNDPDSRKHLTSLANKLSAHTLQVWKEHGPMVQKCLAAALKAEEDIGAMAPIATTICGEILKPDITGTSSSSDTFTFHTGAVVYSQELAAARRDAIDVLIQLAASEDDRHLAISNLFLAGSTPRHAVNNNDVIAMILHDCAYMLRALQPVLTKKPMDVRQDCEQRIFHLWRRYCSSHDDLKSDVKVTEAQKHFSDSVVALRDALNGDQEFVIFKTLVGFRSVFPHMWVEDDIDFGKNQNIRDERQDELLNSVSEETWDIWRQRLGRAAAVQSNDLATLPPLIRFFKQIATRHPYFGLKLLSDRELLPRWTLTQIATALLDTEARADTEATLLAWAEKGKYLPEIALVARFAKEGDYKLIHRIAKISREGQDEQACVILLLAAVSLFNDDKAFWRDAVFFPCLNTLHAAGNHSWIDNIWIPDRGDSLFVGLSVEQRMALLDAMVGAPRIDDQAQAILRAVAHQDHRSVLEFFGRRIAMADHERWETFDAVPDTFNDVCKELQPHPKDIIDTLHRWNDAGSFVARWQLSHFLSRVYPEFQSPLQKTLLELIANADSDKLCFIASLLKGFGGRKDMLPILHAILASDAATDDIETTISNVFCETGVVAGEFGIAQSFQAKAGTIRPWLDDDSWRVKSFAKKEIRSLEREVAAETKRANEEIARRRLDYGEPIGADDN